MKHFFTVLVACLLLFSCAKTEKRPRNFSSVTVEELYNDSISIRAIEILNDGSLAFAANKGAYGLYNPTTGKWATNTMVYDSVPLHFRAVAHTATDFFMLTVANPALLYKTGDNDAMELVYKEEHEKVFYDAMKFWNDKEGIAIGDSVEECLSIIITRDGGKTWTKLPCDILMKTESVGAFAASNTNIEIVGDKTWVATTSGYVYYSPDKGKTWEFQQTPIINEKETQGMYSLDFYNENIGYAIGGDYTTPNANKANKIHTTDGGKTWQLAANNQEPGYRSCVQYVPEMQGKELVAVGFKGIDFSKDGGMTWKHLSDEGFFTLRFINDSTAYAAGSNRIAKLTFKE
jgi:photosystem II stability/assembly factor-like uncharacterized protein